MSPDGLALLAFVVVLILALVWEARHWKDDEHKEDRTR